MHLYSPKEELSTSGFEAGKALLLLLPREHFYQRPMTYASKKYLQFPLRNGGLLHTFLKQVTNFESFKVLLEDKSLHREEMETLRSEMLKCTICLEEISRGMILNWCTSYSETVAKRTVHNYQRHPQLGNTNREKRRNAQRCQV